VTESMAQNHPVVQVGTSEADPRWETAWRSASPLIACVQAAAEAIKIEIVVACAGWSLEPLRQLVARLLAAVLRELQATMPLNSPVVENCRANEPL